MAHGVIFIFTHISCFKNKYRNPSAISKRAIVYTVSLIIMDTTTPDHSEKPSIDVSMSLLSGSPVPPSNKPFAPSSGTPIVNDDAMTQPHAPHEALLKEAVQWVQELETVRDDLYMLSVRNAILLDSLAMAGATEQQVSDDDEQDD
jgi:hypothetical protein